MRLFTFFIMLLVSFGTNADAATPSQRRGGATAGSAQSASGTTSARAAVSTRSATNPSAPAVAARSATTGRTTVTRGPAPAVQPAGVAARAATTQKVINKGTKVTSATQNVVVSEECRQKYDGCMDSFCMLDNTAGGRCICSDRNSELNDILAEIEKLDQQSYQMATLGVEKIEMGKDAEQAIANANAAAQSVIKKDEETKKSARRSLDLSAWNTLVDFDSDDTFDETNTIQNTIDGKEGDALHRAAAQICTELIPECGSDISMLQMMYSQKVRSDCTAYENSLKQQKTASAQKLYAAEQALREAALEQLHIANKYDLGQCTAEFKKCMITTGGCGEDFSNCASVAAMDNTNTTKSTKDTSKMYSIKGSATTIEIFASTYDVLESKKPLCMNITESCVAVKDQVWNTFLREVAPQIKSAELIAEDKARQECVGNISACFQKACKDTIDPNDPEGSYDMCLSRPLTMLNVCKIPLNACGISTNSKTDAENSQIWQFVVARLASMRVDSCTKEVKQCLTSDDRCGEDYTKCVGLDTDSIIRMCPYEKLTGCVELYGNEQVKSDEVYDKLADMVQGIMLNIDNNMLTQCQNAANEAMIRVCGDTESCNGLAVDDNIGARSLEYKICQYDATQNTPNYNTAACYAAADNITEAALRDTPLAGVLSGLIFWNSIDFDEDGNLTNMTDYITKTGLEMTDSQQSRMRTELESLQTNIQSAIQTIESDPTVQFCMSGREVQGMRTKQNEGRSKIGEKSADVARFPGLTKQMRQTIAIAALQAAKDNYYKQYDQFSNKMLSDFKTIGTRLIELNKDDNKDAQREAGRVACNNLASLYNISKAETPESPDTANLSTAAAGITQDTYIMPFTGENIGIKTSSEKATVINKKLNAEAIIKNLTLIQTTSTTYNWDTMLCQKCITEQKCTKVKKPWFRSKYCASWTDAKTTCSDIQF